MILKLNLLTMTWLQSGMPQEENYKRRQATHLQESPTAKKRVVLGDLTNCESKSIAKKKKTKTKTEMMQKCNQSPSPSIFNHLHALEMEVKRRALGNYAEREVSNEMRETLVDWLVEVAEEYKLTSDTLHLAVSCLDRFLSTRPIHPNHLQLLGVSSMLFASVFIEAAQKDFLHSKQQLEFLASYLLELCLLDSKCIKFLPSIAAASALFLSRFIIEPNRHPWNPALQCQTGYKPPDLKECVLAIHAAHSIIPESPLQGVRQKYLQHKFTCVASLTAGEIPASYFEPIYE